ncbi:hypothetical protein ABIF20_004742 [Bradyrhizobium japonicum]
MNMQRKSPTAADLDAIYGSRFYNGSNLGANRRGLDHRPGGR